LANKIQSIRGMNDILPTDIHYWQYIEKIIQELVTSYGYQEIRFPVLEKTELFKRTIGEVTDIVGKEMYTFNDRDGDSVTLRPEGTACCVRAAIEHGLLYNQVQRLWYSGAMFRHERPQLGRYRQFYQVGVEVFGLNGPDIDAELILMTAHLWRKLNIQNKVVLQLNSLGTLAARLAYREIFVEYCKKYIDKLDDDSKKKLTANPLRILDSKNPEMKELIDKAPRLDEYLDEESKNHFVGLRSLLDSAGIKYQINPHLVRGLDYYGRTVFEWVTDQLGAQGTICAGGRYDSLVEQLGDKATPAVGFAIGLERVITLLKMAEETVVEESTVDVYLLVVGDKAQQHGVFIADQIRQALPKLRMLTHCGGGGMKNQFKRADKSSAKYAIILGDDEIEKNMLTLKNLRVEEPQQLLSLSDLVERLKQ
jgi:histidyl-tRNA synthetase